METGLVSSVALVRIIVALDDICVLHRVEGLLGQFVGVAASPSIQSRAEVVVRA